MKNVTPEGEKKALPSGDHGSTDAQGQDGFRGAVPTLRPWENYDMFVKGYTIEEIALEGAEIEQAESIVSADIEEMRGRLMLQYPGITAEEADRLRHETLLVVAGHKDGSAPGIKAAAEASIRRNQIIDAGGRRVQKAQEER